MYVDQKGRFLFLHIFIYHFLLIKRPLISFFIKKRDTILEKNNLFHFLDQQQELIPKRKKKVIIKSFFSFQTDISLGGASALFEEDDCFPLGFVPNIDEIAGPLPDTDVIV